MSSYEDINYSLRPGKNIERKMLCDALIRLSLIKPLSRYRYIGFGSPYFSDFILAHKKLGIRDLVSIEKDKHNEDRFLFNKPFSCINMHFKESHECLPQLSWDKKPTIAWLDYDGKLDKNKLSDIETFFFKAEKGSVFIISINCHPDIKDEGQKNLKQLKIEALKERIGEDRVPANITSYQLAKADNHILLRNIINSEIAEVLGKRNSVAAPQDKIEYKQIFNFIYEDGVKMLTLGGIIYTSKEQPIIEKMEFDNLDFVRLNEDCFNIQVPQLTFKEIGALDALLPDKINNKGAYLLDQTEKIIPPQLKPSDITKYSKIYRYFPNFSEVAM